MSESIVYDREFFAKAGAKGGSATARSRTAKQRQRAARKAARARWEAVLKVAKDVAGNGSPS